QTNGNLHPKHPRVGARRGPTIVLPRLQVWLARNRRPLRRCLQEWPKMAGIGLRKQDDALALTIASGRTLPEAAASAGIGERTARRRWADPAFRNRVQEIGAEMVSR